MAIIKKGDVFVKAWSFQNYDYNFLWMVFPKLRLQFFVEIIQRNCNSNFVVAIIWKGKYGMTIQVKLVHHLIFTLSATVLPCCLSS